MRFDNPRTGGGSTDPGRADQGWVLVGGGEERRALGLDGQLSFADTTVRLAQ
ncbi:hypothetical protein ACFQZ0_31260 [Streptomyces erythrogriseus]|uniref:Uncharacterized protein n=2 Tax=Streptomyces griseoincarnatus group TaxID=2867193 RepID=A0ABP6JRL4_9ACTN|nr:hypothetical protein GCM10010265_63680 [Streptomyces griseoincarnatus]GGT80852.1 hypothetical protein GCM10010287_64100 [Streptomyces variabilis]